jgi:hypothetical protein
LKIKIIKNRSINMFLTIGISTLEDKKVDTITWKLYFKLGKRREKLFEKFV